MSMGEVHGGVDKMSDQAEELREAARRLQGRESKRKVARGESEDATRVVAVTSGKGGVGKTSFVV
ncbi:MAG TPA: sodium:proton antiporter, partial [Bacillota bacterium]|nr:sodium:proton antiporter [Bacillota bacterium]